MLSYFFQTQFLGRTSIVGAVSNPTLQCVMEFFLKRDGHISSYSGIQN